MIPPPFIELDCIGNSLQHLESRFGAKVTSPSIRWAQWSSISGHRTPTADADPHAGLTAVSPPSDDHRTVDRYEFVPV